MCIIFGMSEQRNYKRTGSGDSSRVFGEEITVIVVFNSSVIPLHVIRGDKGVETTTVS